MPNLRDHVMEIGGLTLQQRPFDVLDSLVFAQLVYMPMEGLLDGGGEANVAQAGAFLTARVPCEQLNYFARKSYRLFEECARLPRYGDIVMRDYVNVVDEREEVQFAACTFVLPGGMRYVAYRGTDMSLAGWKEDLNMSFMTVPAQRRALAYLRRAARGNADALLTGGHSKGGNLAVYAAAHADARLRSRIRCVDAFDAPGVDEDTFRSQGYAAVAPLIRSYVPNGALVGLLLCAHPVYTVVRASAPGLLQHDALSWQVRDGAFVTVPEVDAPSLLAADAIRCWLHGCDAQQKRFLADIIYRVAQASGKKEIHEIYRARGECVPRMWEAVQALDMDDRRSAKRMLRELFTTGAAQAVRDMWPRRKGGPPALRRP